MIGVSSGSKLFAHSITVSALVPKELKVSPAYLQANSTSHIWPFSAVAELIDNAYDPDVNASDLWIDKKEIDGTVCLTFRDNGYGMDEEKLLKMLSFGYCEKVQVGKVKPIGHYGNGFKSGSMRLGKDALVFTRTENSMSVGFLSQTYLTAINAETVIVPIVTWSLPDNKRLDRDSVNNNLESILKYSIIHSEKDLIRELDNLEPVHRTRGSAGGTSIFIYNLKRDSSDHLELDFESDPLDIRNPESQIQDHASTSKRTTQVYKPVYRRSLREYCSILFLKPRMKITLRGTKVMTKYLSKALSKTEKDTYKPLGLNAVKITFGFTSSRDAESYGLNVYHRNRLITAFDKIGCQNSGKDQGVGVVGIVEADFLEPIHNKQDFLKTDRFNAFMNSMAGKLNDYCREKTQGEVQSPEQQEDTKPDWTWVQCDNCLKWRRLLDVPSEMDFSEKWFCYQNVDASFNRCAIPEEPEDEVDTPRRTYKKTFKRKESHGEEKKTTNVEEPSASASQAKDELAKAMSAVIQLDAKRRVIEEQKMALESFPISDVANKSIELVNASQVPGLRSPQTLPSDSEPASGKKRQSVTETGGGGGKMARMGTGELAPVRRKLPTSDTGGEARTVNGGEEVEMPDDRVTPAGREIKTEDELIEANGSSEPSAVETLYDPAQGRCKNEDEEHDNTLFNKQISNASYRAVIHRSTQTPPDNTEQRLRRLQNKIHHLMHIIVPDFDYGQPDDIETIIEDFIKVNQETD